MKKISLTIIVVLLLVAFAPQGCNKSRKIPKDFDYGTWNGTTYRNDFFGFSITVPEGWHVSGEAEMKAIVQDGQDFLEDVATNKAEMKKQMKQAEISTANLFMVGRYSTEKAMELEESNPNILLMVEKLTSIGQKIDRAKYVSLLRQNLTKAMPGVVIKSQSDKIIGGQEFTSLQIQFSAQGLLISQEHLVCVKNDFAVIFGLTTLDDLEKPQLDDIMATLQWD